MFVVGVLYILFEQSILSDSADRPGTPMGPLGSISRSILGVQVGLIVLAMIVTRSSIASLQAKKGLPLGNQLMGWIVLGEIRDRTETLLYHANYFASHISWDPIFTQSTSE